jgi:CsoR family transcriptional regulator, copper-sensing transcriptional repressor
MSFKGLLLPDKLGNQGANVIINYVKINIPPNGGLFMKKNTSEKDVTLLLKTAEGQLKAVLSMYENHRYCVDITKQVLAVQALLKKANNLILRNHMDHCVKEALDNKKPDEKLKELSELMDLIQQ